MALLTGCDYSEGVHGIGKDSVLKFFETVSDEEVLDTLRSWKGDIATYEKYEKRLTDKNVCTSCGHQGKVQQHTKIGCSFCKTTKGCDPFQYKNERLKIKNEVNMRNKAIKDPDFPNELLIKEFLDRKDDVQELNLTWKQPNVVKFLEFTTKFLQWDELYAFEKILPILTRWQCRNPELHATKLKGSLKPDRIKKVRNPKGVPSYEIIWSDPGECFKGLIPDNQMSNVDEEKLWSTIEPQHLVDKAYPQLVEEYRKSKIKPKKGKKRNKHDDLDELMNRLDNVSLSETESKKSSRRRGAKLLNAAQPNEEDNCKNKAVKKGNNAQTRTLDSFLKKAIKNSYKPGKDKLSLDSSTPTKSNVMIDLNTSSFEDETDLDLSDIIDDIVSRKEVQNDLKCAARKYVNEPGSKKTYMEEGESENGEGDDLWRWEERDDLFELQNGASDEHECRSSSFFLSTAEEENDGFEKTFNEIFKNVGGDSSDSDMEEYEYELNDATKRRV